MADAEELPLQRAGSAGGAVGGGDTLAMVGDKLGTSLSNLGAFRRAYRPNLTSGLDAFLAFGDACFVYLTDAFRHVDPFEIGGGEGFDPLPAKPIAYAWML